MSENSVELLSTPYGEVSYETFRKEGYAFVDKTSLIRELERKNTTKHPVLLRPRRFGKSTFVQMLKCFYDISYIEMYDEIFSETDIYKDNLETRNSYHVIDFDFSGVSGDDKTTLIKNFIVAVDFGISNFLYRYRDFVFNPADAERSTPSGFIKSFFKAYYNYPSRKSLYVMIDEYDNFANSILSKDLNLFQTISETSGFVKDFYAAIKDGAKNIVAKTFITGVSSVSLDSLTSGCNIARNVTSFECFNEYAGFTEKELAVLIPQLVDAANIGVTIEEFIARMKPVYDGYCFSYQAKNTVYNPSMCLYYLDEVRQAGEFLSPEKCLDPASDHDGSKLLQLFRISEEGLADKVIENYLSGEYFYIDRLSENINLNQSSKYNRDQIISMLYYLGYLTVDRDGSDSSTLALKIPNLYMSKLFAQCTAELRIKNNKTFADSHIDISALQEGKDDITSFANSCTEFMSAFCKNQVLSHMNEMALNLVLYTKLSGMSGVRAEMQKSLQVSGDGERFADLVVTVNKGSPRECVYLFELKYVSKTAASDGKVQSLINEASKQALRYKTAMDFRNKQIKAYAMVFAGPDCVYCKMQQ